MYLSVFKVGFMLKEYKAVSICGTMTHVCVCAPTQQDEHDPSKNTLSVISEQKEMTITEVMFLSIFCFCSKN